MSEGLIKKLAILLASLIVLFISLINSENILKPVTVFKEGTKIGSLDLSRVRWETGYATLQSKLNDPIYVHLDNQSRGVTLKEIGFDIDRDKLAKLTKTCKSGSFRLLCSNTSNERIDPDEVITINNWLLTKFLDEIQEEAQPLSENTIVSFIDNSFRAVVPGTEIEIDMSDFVDKKAIAEFLTTDEVKIQLKSMPPENKEEINKATDSLIETVSSPLLIKYGRNPVNIPYEKMFGFIDIKKENGLDVAYINRNNIGLYLDELKDQYGNGDVIVTKEPAVDAISRAILFRATNYEINNAVILPLEGMSKTNGELHDRYVEVIKSQQRAYRFEGGKLTKTYIVSTGLTWETPPGNYEVLGKQKMTISYFGNWYMPNYLPIGTVYGYRFGFHAIPYHMDGAGNIYSRDPNTMGSPATGGCIQMTEADSLELFNWANVGMPVYVYE